VEAFSLRQCQSANSDVAISLRLPLLEPHRKRKIEIIPKLCDGNALILECAGGQGMRRGRIGHSWREAKKNVQAIVRYHTKTSGSWRS
jgi:hypothetical protein